MGIFWSALLPEINNMIAPVHKWTEEEIKILIDNYDTITLPELHEKYFNYLTFNQVRSKKRSIGLKSTNKKLKWNCYKNENYFSEPNTINSYWAGFIAADGSISSVQTSRGEVRGLKIQLSAKDKSHLELFKEHIEYTGNILNVEVKHKNLKHFQTKRMNGKIYKSVMLQFCNKQICKDLERNFCISKRKSLTMIPPKHLTLENSLAFIKGYSDGDGCISIYKKRKKQYLSWSIAGTYETLDWIKNTINNLSIVNNIWKQNIYKYKKNNIYRLDFKYIKYIVPLLKYLQTIETPELKRKWNKIEQYENLRL